MGKLQIVGLGPGAAGLITMAAIVIMKRTPCLLLRTAVHPAAAYLDEKGIAYEALDRFYENCVPFEDVYTHIADYVMSKVAGGDVVYAVPGSPAVAEDTVRILEKRCAAAGVSLEILPGMSFLEALYTETGIDPINGLLVLDGFELSEPGPLPPVPVVITQVCNRQTASNIKLLLADRYGDEYEIFVAHHISLEDERIERIKLYELDRLDYMDHLTSLVLPPSDFSAKRNEAMPFDMTPLIKVTDTLRGEHGCPWDSADT
jgi:tetrapyrrole methylase family protein/MazG family protein